MKSGRMAKPAGGVSEYIGEFPRDVQRELQRLRKVIKSAAPRSEEVISYRIPTYKYLGTLVHFMAREGRCSFITTSYSVMRAMRRELKEFSISGTTIHFTPDHPISSDLIETIVRRRVQENEAASRKVSRRNQPSQRVV